MQTGSAMAVSVVGHEGMLRTIERIYMVRYRYFPIDVHGRSNVDSHRLMLKVLLPLEKWSDIFQIILDQPLPLLEIFHLSTPPFRINVHPLYSPSLFMTKAAPNLREEPTRGFNIPLHRISEKSDVTELGFPGFDLSYYTYERKGFVRPSVDEFFTCFESMSQATEVMRLGDPD